MTKKLFNNKTVKRVKIHASSLGECPRALSLQMIGVGKDPTPAHLKKIFEKGNEIEKKVLSFLKVVKGWKVKPTQTLSKTVEIDGILIEVVGNPDGFRLEGYYNIPLEIKSMNSFRSINLFRDGFNKWKDFLKLKYSFQLGAYLWLSGEKKIWFIVQKKDKEGEDKTSISNLRLFPLGKDDVISEDAIMEKLSLSVQILKGIEVLPPNIQWCKGNCYFKSSCLRGHTKFTVRQKNVDSKDSNLIRSFQKVCKEIELVSEDLEVLKHSKDMIKNLLTLKYSEHTLNESLENLGEEGI